MKKKTKKKKTKTEQKRQNSIEPHARLFPQIFDLFNTKKKKSKSPTHYAPPKIKFENFILVPKMTDSESTIAPPTPEMESEYQDQDREQQQPNPTKKPTNNGNTTTTTTTNTNTNTLAFSIWPPTQRTRDAVVARLVETLSTQSILSKRYGTLPSDEASSAARLIEEEAFSAAAASASAEDDGIEILQVYSREISRRMLDTVKNRASSAASSVDDAGAAPQTSSLEAASATAASEDNSPTVTES